LEDAQASSVNDPMMKNGHVADFAALARGHAEKRAWNIQRAKVLEQARAAQQAGRPAEARRLLQSILDQDPSDQDARAALAGLTDILVAVKNTFQEESRRKEIGERMSRGTTLLIQERYTDALEQFSRVLELDPEHRDAREQSQEVRRIMRGQGLYIPPVLEGTPAEAAYREGLRLYGNEDLPGARAAFEKALTLDPKHGAARQALQRILKD
jgi:tetratricopeptide (TPR) repeat protein